MVLALPGGPQKGLSPLSKRGSGPLGPRQGQLPLRLRDVAEVDQEQAEVETDGLGVRVAPGEGPEPGERGGRPLLVVQPDGSRGQRFGVGRCGSCGRGELSLG
jgi:hypothetical protein